MQIEIKFVGGIEVDPGSLGDPRMHVSVVKGTLLSLEQAAREVLAAAMKAKALTDKEVLEMLDEDAIKEKAADLGMVEE